MRAGPVHEFEVQFTLKSRPDIGFSFDRAIRLGGATLETREGKIHGAMTLCLESGDPNAAREKALEEAEKIASLLSLALNAGFAVEEVQPDPCGLPREPPRLRGSSFGTREMGTQIA